MLSPPAVGRRTQICTLINANLESQITSLMTRSKPLQVFTAIEVRLPIHSVSTIHTSRTCPPFFINREKRPRGQDRIGKEETENGMSDGGVGKVMGKKVQKVKMKPRMKLGKLNLAEWGDTLYIYVASYV